MQKDILRDTASQKHNITSSIINETMKIRLKTSQEIIQLCQNPLNRRITTAHSHLCQLKLLQLERMPIKITRNFRKLLLSGDIQRVRPHLPPHISSLEQNR